MSGDVAAVMRELLTPAGTRAGHPAKVLLAVCCVCLDVPFARSIKTEHLKQAADMLRSCPAGDDNRAEIIRTAIARIDAALKTKS